MPRLQYPHTPTVDVVDEYFGTPVADPYRWLEDAEAPEVESWTQTQHDLAVDYLRALPGRDALTARLGELWNFEVFNGLIKRKERVFFMKQDGRQNQPVLYVQDGDAEARILIDPNTFSEDGTIALTSYFPSPNGKWVAYLTSESGSDWVEIRLRDVENGRDTHDRIQQVKFTIIAWKKDHTGFYYSRFSSAQESDERNQAVYHQLFFHVLGLPQDEDREVYARPDLPASLLFPTESDDGQYLILHVVGESISKNRLYYRQSDRDGDFTRLFDLLDAEYSFLGNVNASFFIKTTHSAPRGRIILVDVNDPAQWREIVPEQPEVIEQSLLIGQTVILVMVSQASHIIKLYDLDGNFLRQLDLPAVGSVNLYPAGQQDTGFFFDFSSYLFPTTVMYCDLESGEIRVFKEIAIPFDSSGYETRRHVFHSKDGTPVSMFLTHRKGVEPNGANPTILTGYGGFNVNNLPLYTNWIPAWLEQGGILAVVHLRGGGEYGEEWHQGGMLDRKQNTFDDFIAAAEYLIAAGYTSTPRLAIEGGSNGGLLVAACMLQRPDLFGAVICRVPVADMLRFQKFTAGRYWTPEYGDAESSREHFEFLYAYSPLHNVRKGVSYPPILIDTADHDDRVVPMHSKKFAAALQAADPGSNVILLRIELKAGHGFGKPVSKQIETRADFLVFLAEALQLR